MPIYVQSQLLVLCTDCYLHMGLAGSTCTTTISGAVYRLLFASCTVVVVVLSVFFGDEGRRGCIVLVLNRDCCLQVVPFRFSR